MAHWISLASSDGLECCSWQAHKQQSGCTGKRPRTERVAPLNAFTDNVRDLRGTQGAPVDPKGVTGDPSCSFRCALGIQWDQNSIRSYYIMKENPFRSAFRFLLFSSSWFQWHVAKQHSTTAMLVTSPPSGSAPRLRPLGGSRCSRGPRGPRRAHPR